jgi:hypothetical protein
MGDNGPERGGQARREGSQFPEGGDQRDDSKARWNSDLQILRKRRNPRGRFLMPTLSSAFDTALSDCSLIS